MASKSLAPSDTMVIFVENVNSILEHREMSKSELARMCEMPLPALRRLLNSRGGSCSFATADKIAHALGLSVIEILNGGYE